jgi:integrase/recombinase XerD
MVKLTLSQAIEGFILYKTATGVSERTVSTYRTSFHKLTHYLHGDPPLIKIDRQTVVAFLAWLQSEYTTTPDGVAPRGTFHLSPKTVYNIYTNLSALWTWAIDEGLVNDHIIRTIDAPQYDAPVIEPLSKEDVKALLRVCNETSTWKNRQPQTTSRRPTAERDRAIILILLDTGIRASELCEARICDVDMTSQALRVAGKGKGRGKKERIVRFGHRTGRAIWRYLTPRLEFVRDDDTLIAVGSNETFRPMTRDVLRKLIKRLGTRAGIENCYPHRFRHTFSINYLRNGGDIFTLQRLLGHTSLEMVKRYLNIVQTDIEEAHRRASPVDNWRL